MCTDVFTRYAETRAVSNQKAITIARFLIEQILSRHGCPKIMISDRGRGFISRTIKNINLFLQTQHLLSSPYHPQTNGLVERTNQTLCTMLRHYVQQERSRWNYVLPMVTFAYNSNVNSGTKTSPFYLLYGREPLIPIDVNLNARRQVDINMNQYLTFIFYQFIEGDTKIAA